VYACLSKIKIQYKETNMSAYLVATYRVINPEGFAPYPEAATKTLADAGAEIVAVDVESEVLEGDGYPATVIIKFESKETLKAWYNSPEYQAIAGMRKDNSEGSLVMIDGIS